MPTYEYKCKNCGYYFEIFQSMNDAPLKTCEKCHTDSLKRLIGRGAGIIFKGTGFYETDYRSDSYKKAEKKEKETKTPNTSNKKETTKKTDNKSKKTSDTK